MQSAPTEPQHLQQTKQEAIFTPQICKFATGIS